MTKKPILRSLLTTGLLLALAGCHGPLPNPVEAPQVMTSGFRTQADYGRATTAKGVGVDPVNLVFVGNRWEVAGAFHKAGWVEADPITAANLLRQGRALFGKAYITAPFSDLYYLNRKQDLAFQKNATDIKKRDHLRLWQTEARALDGRPLWMCAASRDIGIGFSKISPTLITHKVEANRDLERDLVVADLQAGGRMAALHWLPGTPYAETKPIAIESDGRIALIVLTPIFNLFGFSG